MLNYQLRTYPWTDCHDDSSWWTELSLLVDVTEEWVTYELLGVLNDYTPYDFGFDDDHDAAYDRLTEIGRKFVEAIKNLDSDGTPPNETTGRSAKNSGMETVEDIVSKVIIDNAYEIVRCDFCEQLGDRLSSEHGVDESDLDDIIGEDWWDYYSKSAFNFIDSWKKIRL